MLESVERMRRCLKVSMGTCTWEGWLATRDKLSEMLDAVEREVEEKYIPYPLDAEDVPIHIGDVMEGDGVRGKALDIMYHIIAPPTVCVGPDGEWCEAGVLTHRSQSSVEDVLREFYVYAVRGKETYAEDVDDAVVAEYAARLRLVEEGA